MRYTETRFSSGSTIAHSKVFEHIKSAGIYLIEIGPDIDLEVSHVEYRSYVCKSIFAPIVHYLLTNSGTSYICKLLYVYFFSTTNF